MINKNLSVCFIGHRKIQKTPELENRLYEVIENLIVNGASTFYFGCSSQFNDLCRSVVTSLKTKYPYIKRIYVRAKFPIINDEYYNYLLDSFEDTYYPKQALNSGKACYIKRNCEMIDRSDCCIFYYDPDQKASSGTATAFNYALRKNRTIKNTLID